MIRRALVLAFALVSAPAMLHAQDVVMTVSVASADVHKGPSTVTPVIGHVPRGTAMPVLRNLGSWVKIEWPDAPDGVAYLHVSMGRLTPAKAGAAVPGPSMMSSSATGAARPASLSSPPADPQAPNAPRPRTAPRERVAVSGQGDATPISHVFGVGAAIGSMHGIGASGRAWRDSRLGLQVAFTHESMKSGTTADRVTALQVEPAIVFGLTDLVSDYFWIRPYVGSGVSIRHQTLHDSASAVSSENGVGYRVFGGSEMTFAGAMRFALSVDAGYRNLPAPFPGFPNDHFAASIAGHWYFK